SRRRAGAGRRGRWKLACLSWEARPPGAAALSSALLAFRQGDGDVEHVVVAVLDQVDLDRIDVDVDVLLDDVQQLAPQQRQVVRGATAVALLGNDDLQPVLGRFRSVLLGPQEVEERHGQPSNSLLKKPFFSRVVKRSGRSSPSRRATASS